jgi:PPOX class probable F420-dependent enzyme
METDDAPDGKPDDEPLTGGQRAFLLATRRAVLVTIAPDGRPRAVPICFVVSPDAAVLYTPIDDKPKRSMDSLSLSRVRDIASDPRVTVLADRWDEDWTRLAWLRVDGRASLIEPGERAEPAETSPAAATEHEGAVSALRAKYEQYAEHALEDRPLIRIEVERTVDWGDLGLETVYGG